MDAAVVETLLPTDADRDAVADEIATAARMGITGVPCFLLENKYAVMGAQDSETLADAIRQVAAAKARGELDSTALFKPPPSPPAAPTASSRRQHPPGAFPGSASRG